MKNASYILLLVILTLSLIALTGCESLQLTGTEKAEEPVPTENMIMSKKTTSGWDCYGYATWRATGEHYEESLGSLDPNVFEEGSINDACIVEWDDHAAYIDQIYVYGDTVKVDEWYTSEIQYGNVYDIGERHLLGGDWLRWVKKKPPPPPPDPVWVEIEGPTTLDWDEEGEFEADAHDGYTPYSNYEWWWRISEGEERRILAPPPGEWQELDGLEGEQTIEWGYEVSFDLKCRVTDDENNTAVDEHHVEVSQE